MSEVSAARGVTARDLLEALTRVERERPELLDLPVALPSWNTRAGESWPESDWEWWNTRVHVATARDGARETRALWLANDTDDPQDVTEREEL